MYIIPIILNSMDATRPNLMKRTLGKGKVKR